MEIEPPWLVIGMATAVGLAPNAFEIIREVDGFRELTVKVASAITPVARVPAFIPKTTQFIVPAEGEAHVRDLPDAVREGSATIETALMSDVE